MNHKRIIKSALLGSAALSGFVAGQQNEEFVKHTIDTVIVHAQDTFQGIKGLLITRVNESNLLGEDSKQETLSHIQSINSEEDATKIMDNIRINEARASILRLNLSESDKEILLKELDDLKSPEDILKKAMDLANSKRESEAKKQPSKYNAGASVVDSESSDTYAGSDIVERQFANKVSSDEYEVDMLTEMDEVDYEGGNSSQIDEYNNVEPIVVESIDGDSDSSNDQVEHVYKNIVEEVDEWVSEDITSDYYTIDVSATAYSRNQPELGNITASGIDLTTQTNVIAVDPSVIPLGSTVEIPGYGTFIAGDTGSAIKGNKIDIHMEDLQEAINFGRKSMTIKVYTNTSNQNEYRSPIVNEVEDENTNVNHNTDYEGDTGEEINNYEDIDFDSLIEESIGSSNDLAKETGHTVVENLDNTVIEEDIDNTVIEEGMDNTVIEDFDHHVVEETDDTTVEEVGNTVVEEVNNTIVEEDLDYTVDQTASPNYSENSNVLGVARKYVGTPYVWGGKTPDGFDCSGFTSYVYREATGQEIGGWTGAQESAGPTIDVSQAQAGDLYFWGSQGSSYHVAIATDNQGGYIHAPQPGEYVTESNTQYFTPNFAVSMQSNR